MAILERDDATALLEAARAAAVAGAGRFVLVEGGAGLGKTTLVRAFTEDVGGRVLWGSCEPLGAPRPLGPLHDFARVAGGELGAVMASVHTRHESFEALLDHLTGRPTVAVIDDIHWADDATLDLLLYVSRRIGSTRSLVVATVRSEEVSSRPRVLELLGHLANLGVERIALEPLTPAGVAELAGGQDALALHDVTGGNPFFVSEVLAAGPSTVVPLSVRDLVLSRVGRLSERARSAVDAVSVLADGCDLALLYAVSGADADAVAECEQAQILVSEGHTVRFRHELGRLAVSGALAGSRSHQLHQAVLAELAQRPRHRVARLSFHAAMCGDGEAVLRFAPEAAIEAVRVGAHREACVHLGRALEHADRLDPLEHADLLSSAADAHDHVGDMESALDLSEESMVLFREHDDSDRLAARTAKHAMLLWSAARSADARRCAEEAVSIGGLVPESRGQGAAWTSDAYLRMLARDADGAIRVGELAISLARQLADQHLLARALTAVGSARFIAGQPEVGTELLLEAVAIARAVHDDDRVGSAMVNLGSSAGECRQYEIAEHWLRACQEWCGQRDLMPNLSYSRAWLARVAFERGDWETAAEMADQGLEGEVISSIVSLTVLGRLAARRGDADADGLLSTAWDLAQRTEDLQRLWPTAAARAEAAYLAGHEDHVPELVGDTFDRAVELHHAWAVGELGYWLWRAGCLTPEQQAQMLESGAPAYAAQVRGEPEVAGLAWDGLGCPYEAALARSESREPSTVADGVRGLDRLGAGPMADRAAARLRDLGGRRPPRPRGSTATNPGGLTDRELAVLELVADGLTNAEIAERMRISTKTAGHHVSSILAKLGVPGRREASRVADGWRR
jgi:DNA-binding CsgD family transcriptional regulator/tetratricopeptide (TPR) repeat protein